MPDLGYHRVEPVGVWIPTAAIAVEIVSPDDETYAKFAFYFARRVEEIIVVDPAQRTVGCFRRGVTAYVASEKSDLLDVYASSVASELVWP